MKSNQSVLIQLVDTKGEPLDLSGVVVDVHLFVKKNWRYVFRAGKTDSSGQLLVTYQRLEACRQEAAKIWLMDFNTRLEECDRRVRIELPSSEMMAQGLRAVYEQHGLHAASPAEFTTQLKRKVDPVDVELCNETTSVKIVCG